MPIRVRYQNQSDQECTIRPTPLVSIGTEILKNGAGEAFGVTYSITLTGTLLADQGTPYAINHIDNQRYDFHGTPTLTFVGPYDTFDNNQTHILNNKPAKQQIHHTLAATAIMSKQRSLRALFAQDGQRMEITDFFNDSPAIICYPRLVDISFSEGIWIDKCDFTITLEADTLLYGQDDNNLTINDEGTLAAESGIIQTGKTEANLIDSMGGAFISDYSEDWSIEVDESTGESAGVPFSYRISHSLNATGKTHYMPDETKLEAWEQARKFVQMRLASGVNDYPNVMGQLGSGTINLIDSYGGYNHVRSESVGQSAGTYSVEETWLVASGNAYENFSTSTSTSNSSSFVTVSIDGSIKGLSQITPSGFGGIDSANNPTALDNAMAKYVIISNSGEFGLKSDIYKRANNLVAVELNSQPISATIGQNSYNGEVTYALEFDNRPTNFISGVLSENITINDTYPGDVFAVIPVLGRTTGPILQYIGGRTEYTRDLSVNFLMDYTKIPYTSGRNPMILSKPSVIEPTASQIAELIRQASPEGEPGVRKYFVNPPQETWEPKAGNYSFNISWVYELDK